LEGDGVEDSFTEFRFLDVSEVVNGGGAAFFKEDSVGDQDVGDEETHNKLVGIQTGCQANADDAEEQIGVLESEIKAL
jgi:hypothetical protein